MVFDLYVWQSWDLYFDDNTAPETCLLAHLFTQTLIIKGTLYSALTWFLLNFTIVGDIIYKYETIQNDRGAWSESLFNQYYNESMIPDSWMLVMSPNGVRPIWSAGFIFLFWWYRSTLRRVYIRLFSSASVQTKHELPMWNVRVWDTS
jgi:hypothetical protein